MKVRNGFVSNSSSSSYVIIMKETDFDVMMDKLSKLEQAIFAETNPQKVNKFGKKLIKLGWTAGNYSNWEQWEPPSNLKLTEEEQDELDDGPQDIFTRNIEPLFDKYEHIRHEENF